MEGILDNKPKDNSITRSLIRSHVQKNPEDKFTNKYIDSIIDKDMKIDHCFCNCWKCKFGKIRPKPDNLDTMYEEGII